MARKKKGENYVDITKKSSVTCVEWFHGYGGNALGLKRAIPGLQSVAVCERDAFVVANMVSKMEKGLLDAVPIWTDVTDFPCEPFGYQQLDFFAASYPCQGFSHAGKRLGVEDHRHLWPYCRHFIQRVRPGWVWLENVEGHVSLGLSTVLADLEEDGYTAAWGIFSASEVGAPHQRKRVFILAQRIDTGLQRGPESVEGRAEYQRHDGDILRAGLESGSEDVAHLVNEGLQGHSGDVNGEGREPGRPCRPTTEEGVCGGNVWPSRPGQPQHGWEPPRVVGNPGLLRQAVNEQQTTGVKQSSENGVVENPVQQRVQRGPGVPGRNDGSGQDGETALSGGGREDRCSNNSKTQPPVGLHVDGSSREVGAPLTSTPLMGYNTARGDYANQKERAREILQELREQIDAQNVQWTLGGFWSFFTEKILQSELRLDVWPQRVCYFIWAIQTGNEVEGKELPEMWFTKTAWGSPQRPEPREQLKKELDYAMCVLSYEIALERGKVPLERQSEMCDMRKWCEDAWVVSEALVPLTEIWKSTFNEESWANRAYFEAAGLGANRTDELRMLGNGVVPATAEKAFRVLYAELMHKPASSPKPPKELSGFSTQNSSETSMTGGWITPDCSDRRSDKSKQQGLSNQVKKIQ